MGFGLDASTTSKTLVVDRHQSRMDRKRRGVLTSGRLLQECASENGFRSQCWMVTLTYRPDVEWSPRHVTELIDAMRKYFRRRGMPLRYLWVWEPTKAARPHYHVLVWTPRSWSLPKPDKRGWWRHGHTQRQQVRKAVGYCAKYAAKECAANSIPAGCRLYGCGGLDARRRAQRSWWLRPGWLRECVSIGEPVRRARGGGWVSADSGELFPARWRLVRRAPDWSWIELQKRADEA